MKNNKTLLIFIATFSIPFVLAFAVLQFGWFNAGTTNKGELMPAEYSVKAAKRGDLWQIVYLVPEECDALCKQALTAMRQGILAMGKKQGKLLAAPYYSNQENRAMIEKVIAPLQHKQVVDMAELEPSYTNYLDKNYLYLADPFGKVVLRYPLTKNHPEMIKITKNILSDISKLLKYSRTG
ncbi:hypothetical protein [Flocculibacter collagenilyticus]|uniref:hypothetical protein n=1 Tax=Flocculibacter collagenilyticus TaxID=2744479 RepID=UPI0018F3CEE8|nr:hypothetical protein [Flocculibacter collagenilyticus]